MDPTKLIPLLFVDDTSTLRKFPSFQVKFTIIPLQLFIIIDTLGIIVFLGKLLVSQKLGVHSSGRNILGTLLLLNSIGMCLVRIVVRTRILLL